MLYGYLPAVITGFLFTAIPNWTGRLPIRGTPLLASCALACGPRLRDVFGRDRLAAAMLVDASFLLLVALAAAREIIAGRKWGNLSVVVLVLVLLAGNVAFHLEAHFAGAADISIRIGIAVVVLLISLIGGRIIPSFTRNWLVRENPGRLPVPFARFDMLVVAIGALALVSWIVVPDRRSDRRRTRAGRRAAPRPSRTLGWRSNLARTFAVHPACRLRLRADRLPLECGGRFRLGAGGRRYPCLDGGSGRRHDAGGDDPGDARPYRAETDGILVRPKPSMPRSSSRRWRASAP